VALLLLAIDLMARARASAELVPADLPAEQIKLSNVARQEQAGK
jgi:hypothetical protein